MTNKETKIFIGWSGRSGKLLAEAFTKTLGDYPGLKYLNSSNLEIGKKWFEAIDNNIKKADKCIGFVSPGVYRRIWFNFEAGCLYNKFRFYPLVLLGDEETLLKSKNDIPLHQFQSVSGSDKEGLIRMMKEIIGEDARDGILESGFDKWLEKYKSFEDQLKWEARIESTVEPFLDTLPHLKYNKILKNNDPLKMIIMESISELGHEIGKVEDISEFSTSAAQWSYTLAKLKEKYNDELKLKAVSIIDQQDTFWLQDIGRKIKSKSGMETDERIFVFTSEKDFLKYFDTVMEHAKVYKVRVTTMQALSSSFPADANDLGLLYLGDSQLLALYDRSESQKRIRYSMVEKDIKKYETLFERIKKISKEIPATAKEQPSYDELKEELFDELELLQSRFVEMSIYTSIWDYHNHSKNYPYYNDMSETMIDTFKKYRKDETESLKILEFGAGTGNFTERFVGIQNINVVAFEIDWAYFNIANYRFAEHNHIKLKNKDARKHDPSGKYNYIFSCFFDHHLKFNEKTNDKLKYLNNVGENLEKGGLFIVGDSFLRDYEPANEEDRAAAVREYHEHIIDIARREGHHQFANMETNLLRDKLDPEKPYVNDYKISCKEYEKLLAKAGLKVKGEPVRISSPDFQNGGVYVYTIELA